MTVGGVPAGAVGAVIPASTGMTVGGVPVGAVRTIIPAQAGADDGDGTPSAWVLPGKMSSQHG